MLLLLLAGTRAESLELSSLASESSDGTSLEASGQTSSDLLGALRAALASYEETRSALATDSLGRVAGSAATLSEALRAALTDGPGPAGDISTLIEEGVRAAGSVEQAEDLVAARGAFGEVSRVLLLLAAREPSLVEGWHVFACPMVAEGFDKWLQPDAELENPYMGAAMPACGLPTDWSVSEPGGAWQTRLAAPAHATDGTASDSASTVAIFRPGIPGATMADVRDFKFLWREIDELQVWESGDQISVAEFRSKVIEKTVQFLEMGEDAARAFAHTASEEVSDVRDAFLRRRPATLAGPYPDGLGDGFSVELGQAAETLGSLLGEAPRHQLFAPECRKWLLKLAFGPDEEKEAREARPSASPGS